MKVRCNHYFLAKQRLRGWYRNMLNSVDLREENLKSLLADGSFNKVITHAGRFAGRQPSLHIETGLLERVKRAGFGKYVQQFDVAPATFEDQLRKSELGMASKPEFTCDENLFVDAAIRIFEACKFPLKKFKPTTIEYAAENQVNKQSSASFPHYCRKGLVLDHLINEAYLSRSLNDMWLWPMTRGFRIQLRYGKGDELLPKVRVMYPYPGFIIIIEDTFVIPFVQHFINSNTFYVIGRNGKQISDMLRSKFENSNNITSLDVSGYDRDLVRNASIMAFGLLRLQLQLNKIQIKEYENMVSYFCTSLMVSKVKGSPAYGFIKTNGVPSGSGFTNMIDTIAHAIILEYIHPGIINECLICGDDNIFNSKNVNLTTLFEGYKKYFNLEISLEKTDTYKTPDRIHFLGFTWKNFVRLVDTKLVINQMLWHTDFLVNLDRYERELARSASVLLNGANGKDIFQKLFPDVIKALRLGSDIRFIYLYGYQPPTTLPGVISFMKIRGPIPSTNQSLKLHLEKGWLIR